MNKFFKLLLNFFFKGVLLVTPLVLSLYIIYYVITKVDSIVDLGFPGAGWLIVIVTFTMCGFLITTFITAPIFNYFDKLLDRIPLFKLVYSSFRDFLEAFVGEEKKFNEPVLVDMYQNGLKQIGFLTQKDLSAIGLKDEVSVYFPLSYSIAGRVVFVPRNRVEPLHVKPSEAMKFVISGGVTELSLSEKKAVNPNVEPLG